MQSPVKPTSESSGLPVHQEFLNRIIGAYNEGSAEYGLEADLESSRAIIPAGTSALRDFSYIAPEIPLFTAANCVGCMECVNECPDTAILAKVVPEKVRDLKLSEIPSPTIKERCATHFSKTTKYFDLYQKKGKEGGLFSIFIDPSKCKGCAECVAVCKDDALKMKAKTPAIIQEIREEWNFFKQLPETPHNFINEKLLGDMMLAERSLLFVGGGGSCMGCGEGSAIRMMLAATGFVYGTKSMGLVCSTGCNTVFSSTFPYNPFLVPWMNSLFENSPTVAMGVRGRWDQRGWNDKKIWCIGGDGAMFDIGFQPLSRMLISGMDIKVLILDTQVYSNTGGQSSGASFIGQEAKMSLFGKVQPGKTEARKECGPIFMMHGNVLVAQTTPAHTNHFYKAVMAANEFKGPAVVIAYTTCQPEHGVPDHASAEQEKLAVNSRTFPLFIYDPRKGDSLAKRLDLGGNPALKEDWYKHPKTNENIDFVTFARTENRFAKQFDKEGKPSETLIRSQADRLRNWHLLQELAGLR